MICQRIIGGLGNQMFQVACGYALAKKYQAPLLLDTNHFHGYHLHNGFELNDILFKKFSIIEKRDLIGRFGYFSLLRQSQLKILSKIFFLKNESIFIEPQISYSEIPTVKNKIYNIGYFQSEKYFHDFALDVKDLFSFADKAFNHRIIDMARQMNAEASVSVHIRRGDYISNKKNSELLGFVGLKYLKAAVEYISDCVDVDKFYVFSDDLEWARSNLKSSHKIVFVEGNVGNLSYLDMYLMKSCRHHIISNSSFGWWAAWLGELPGTVVVAPKKWFCSGLKNDIVPDRWIKL